MGCRGSYRTRSPAPGTFIVTVRPNARSSIPLLNSAPPRSQLGHRADDVVAHERDLVVRTRSAGRVDAQLGRPGTEDQPPVVGVDVRPEQHVAEEATGRRGIVGEDQRVDAGHAHGWPTYVIATTTSREVGGLIGNGTKMTWPEPAHGSTSDVGITLATP